MVLVRTRPGLVTDVRVGGHALAGGNLHLVEVEYLDDRRYPDTDTVLWEREVGARVLSGVRLPDPEQGQPDAPARFQAFLDAVRWSAVNRLADPDSPGGTGPFLLSPWHGAVQVEEYQLYPVLKALAMPRISLLLADDVGLGKTVEAGLILTELIARRRVRRVLVVCPAALQIQWQEELRSKFNLDFERLDRGRVETLKRELGTDANPWASAPRIITSMDYLRQPDVLSSFLTATAAMERSGGALLPWDLLIVDEAHNFTPGRFHDDSQRCQMLREIAAHFEHRLFLTATPHNGFTVSFTGLLELLDPVRFQQKPELAVSDHKQVRAVMVRRLKSELNARSARPRFPKRHVQALPARLYPEELAIFQALRQYRDQAQAVLGGGEASVERQTARFIFSLLTKRLLSSGYAFARTWWAHVEGFRLEEGDLTTARAAADRAEAAVDDDGEKAEREQDAARQGAAWLRAYWPKLQFYVDRVSAAVTAAGWPRERAQLPLAPGQPLPPDGRWNALVGWLRAHLYAGDRLRSDERLILFTEYRHTQEYLLWRLRAELNLDSPAVLPLYGGAGLELREVVKEQFNDPASPLRILVATDAASEGLNLQASCRYVLHQEIPWNPMRLEQRNGRVDRHGQARDVWVFHFTSDADADMNFLSYVADKVHRVRDDLGSVGQVFDQALQAHFAGRAVGRELLDRQLAEARAASEERRDLAHRDDGEDAQIRKRLADVKVQERHLGLNPRAMARVFTEAVRMAGGQVEPAGAPGVYRLTQKPAAWQRTLEGAFRGPGGQAAAALPKLAFDQGYFEEEVDGRTLFRPRPDTVLLRLGHPLMRKAVGTLRNCLWQQPGPLQRWTIAAGGPDLPEEAVLVLWSLLTATNQLREPVHEEVIPLAYLPLAGDLEPLDPRLWPDVARVPALPLADAKLAAWRAFLQEWWPDYRRLLRRDLERRKEQEQQRLTRWLAGWQERERRSEEQAFAARTRELETGRDVREVERLQKQLIRAERRAAQLTLDPAVNAARQAEVDRLQRELDAANFQLQTSHLQTLRARLERDRKRILGQVIPQRFTLAHLDLQPVAVQLLVRSYGGDA